MLFFYWYQAHLQLWSPYLFLSTKNEAVLPAPVPAVSGGQEDYLFDGQGSFSLAPTLD